jgi:hypothetical protein
MPSLQRDDAAGRNPAASKNLLWFANHAPRLPRKLTAECKVLQVVSSFSTAALPTAREVMR